MIQEPNVSSLAELYGIALILLGGSAASFAGTGAVFCHAGRSVQTHEREEGMW